MYRFPYLLLLLLLVSTVIEAQLPRRPFFGARMECSEDGLTPGCRIVRAVGGTSTGLELRENDIVTHLDGKAVTSQIDFVAQFLEYETGENLPVTFVRNGKTQNTSATIVGRPYETDDNAEVIYDQADYRGGQLRVLINKPRVEGKQPAMLFVPGYTCSTIDGLSDNHPYKRIVDAYVDGGYVTLRIEKSGLGDSQNTPPCQSADLVSEIENFAVGLEKLKSLPYVDTNRIIIVGHSMGGIIAPALSAKNKVAGVVVYGTSARSWFEYQLGMYRVQNALGGLDPIEVEQSVVEQYDLNYRFYVDKEPLVDLAADPQTDSILRLVWGYDGANKIYDRNSEFWRQIQDFPHLENWKNTEAKVLVQFGESDFQAYSRDDHELIVNTVNHFHPGHATLKTFPHTDHYFAKSGTMQEAYDKFTNGQIIQLFDEYNPEVGLSAVRWSDQILGRD